MKRILTIALAAIGLTACSSDDTKESPVNLEHLTQRWYYVSYKLGDQTTPYDGHMPCGKDYLEFQEGNAVRDVDYFDCQEDPTIATGTYTADEENLSIVIDGVTENYTMKKLNSQTLETQATLNGATITYIYTSTP